MFYLLGVNLDFQVLAIIILIPLYLWSYRITQRYGMFTYVNKRKKDVSLHLRPCKTPRNASGSPHIMSSLRDVIRELKRKGYESATFESHLIDERAMLMLEKLSTKEKVVLLPALYKRTPLIFRIMIPLTTLICKRKIMSTNKMSAVVRIQLQPQRDMEIYLSGESK
ncbi:hypothetical protein [Rahnella aceris]